MRWIFILAFLLPHLALAQDLKALPVSQTPLTVDQFIGADDYHNLYYINDNVFHKKSPEKDFQFSGLLLGPISSVDIINPLRITLFYAQVNTAVILDNTLNEITRVDFNQSPDYKNVSHVRTASHRKLWIFNTDLQQLELFDYQNRRTTITSPPVTKKIIAMTSNFNTCWLYDGSALQAYNNYGSQLYTLTIDDLKKIYEFQGNLLAIKNHKIVLIGKDPQKLTAVDFNENEPYELYWAYEILYIYNGKSLNTYSLKIPNN